MKVFISLSSIRNADISTQIPEFESTVTASLQNILGKDFKVAVSSGDGFGRAITVAFYRSHNPEPANGIARNSKSFMHFIIHLTDGRGKPGDMDKIEVERLNGTTDKIPYRKISSKASLLDAGNKFVKWVKKNSEAIKSL